MRYKFQDTSLVVGQIKELLKDFNLPMVQVYTDETVPYDNRVYIRNNEIVRYHKDSDSFQWLSAYTYNREVINLTKKFTIRSSSYDRDTHRYLGEYLRFLRDKNNYDLMSMYNCFDGYQPSRIYNYTKFSENDGYLIDTDNPKYNYYLVPVKFNKLYTVAIDSPCDYDLVCCFYNNKFISDTPVELIKNSLTVVRGSKYNKPFTYSTYFGDDYICNWWTKEKDLCLVLKLPKRITSSITILEGNYTECCNVIDGTLITDFVYNEDKLPTNYFSKNSLLEYNNGISYPFADRLVEYLLGNVIGSRDEIDNNIKRVQDKLYPMAMKGYYGIWTDSVRNDIYKHSVEEDMTKGKGERYGNTLVNLLTEEKIRDPKNFIDLYNDVIGYVDRDTETMLDSLWFTKIIFDHCGGEYKPGIVPTNKIVIKYQSALPSMNVPVKEGYKLMGYFDKEDGQGVQYFTGKGYPVKDWDKIVSEDILFAYWVKE